MKDIGYMVSFIVAMMGVAFPLLLTLISELSDKYGTTQIINRFKREREFSFFVWSLIASIVVSILWIIDLPPMKIGVIEGDLNGSAELMLLLIGSITIGFFFRLVDLMLLYYNPVRISKRLLVNGTRVNKKKSVQEIDESLKIVTSIITSYIGIGSEDIVSELIMLFSEFVRKSISNVDISSGDRIYYDLSRKIFNSILARNDRMFEIHTKDIINNVWFLKQGLMDVDNRNLSYHNWRNLTELVIRDRISTFMIYWEDADTRARDYMLNHDILYNVFSYSGLDDLMHIWIAKLNQGQGCVMLKDSSDKVVLLDHLEPYTDPQNNKLLPLLKYECFHVNLGGLLMFLRKYEVIRRMFSYTASLPPKYYLLPDTFTEVFRFFLMTHDRFDMYYSLTPMTYVFPELEGINQVESTHNIICQYIAILYIRLFSLVPMYSASYHYDLPSLPNSKFMLNAWKLSAEYLNRLVNNLLSNKEVIQGIGLESIIEESRISIIQKLDEFIVRIQDKINLIATNYQPTPEQSTEYLNQVTASLSESIDNVMLIDNKDDISINYSSWHIMGARRIVGKEDFQDDPCRIDFITHPLITGIQTKLYQSFYSQNVTKYLVAFEDLFHAVSKLNADANQFVLIGFNINVERYIDRLKVKELTKNEFQGIELYLYNVSSRHSDSSLFLVSKRDLPKFKLHSSKPEDISKYKLLESNTRIKIFSSLLDLNAAEELADELQPTLTGIEVKKCMLACVDYHIEIMWKNDPQMIHLQVYNRNMNSGIPVELKDISSIRELLY